MNERYGNSRLNKLIDSGLIDPRKILVLDCYNQAVYEDISPTITTRSYMSNMYFISEPTMWQMGYGNGTRPMGFTPDNVCPTITTSSFENNNVIIMPNKDNTQGKTDKIMQIGNTTPTAGITTRDNPNRGRTYDPEGISPTIVCMQGGNLQPQIIERVGDHEKERLIVEPQAEPQIVGYSRDSKGKIVGHHFKDEANTIVTSTGTGNTTDQYVAEPQGINDSYNGEDKAEVMKTAGELREYVQEHRPDMPIGVDVQADGRLRPHIDNDSNFGIMDYYTDHENGTSGTQIATRPTNVYGKQTRYRIRRLTEREVFRLMDVDEWAIDRILDAKDEKGKRIISKSKCYFLAGNSITVNVLREIFRRMFIDTNPTKPYQMSLFD